MKKILSGTLVASCLSMGQLYGLTVDDVMKKCEEIGRAEQLDRFKIKLSCNMNSKFVAPSGLREISEQRAPTSIRVGVSMGKGDETRGGESYSSSYTKVYEHNQRGNHTNCQQYQNVIQLAAYEREFNCKTFKEQLEVARGGGRGDQTQQQQGQQQGQQQASKRNTQIPDHLSRGELDDVAKLCMHSVIDWGDWNQCTDFRTQSLQSTSFNPNVVTDKCRFSPEGDVFGCGGAGKGAAGIPVAQGQLESTDLDFTNNIPAGLLTLEDSKYNTVATEQTKDFVNEVRTRVVAHGTCNPLKMCRKEIELLDTPQADTIFGQLELQKGDRIYKVDGIHFVDADALRKHLYGALSSSRVVKVIYFRGPAREERKTEKVLKALAPTSVTTTQQQVHA